MRRLSWLVIIGGGVLILLLLASSFISPFIWGRSFASYRYGWGMMGDSGFALMGMMGLGMFFYWLLILGGVVWLVATLARGAERRSVSLQSESVFDILQRRYSRGEITIEQYDGMKRDLGL